MKSSAKLPDPGLCRTQQVVSDLWECLVDLSGNAIVCRYALVFGYSHFCRHPENKAFVDTEKVKSPKKYP